MNVYHHISFIDGLGFFVKESLGESFVFSFLPSFIIADSFSGSIACDDVCTSVNPMIAMISYTCTLSKFKH